MGFTVGRSHKPIFSIGLAHRTNGNETLAREAFANAIAADATFMPAQLANMG